MFADLLQSLLRSSIRVIARCCSGGWKAFAQECKLPRVKNDGIPSHPQENTMAVQARSFTLLFGKCFDRGILITMLGLFLILLLLQPAQAQTFSVLHTF